MTSPDVTVSGRVVLSNRVDEGILEVAEAVKADIIVVGTRGLSLLRGAIMGALWNYALSSLFVWRTR